MPSSHPQSRSTARTGDKGAPREGQQGNLPPTPGLQSFGSNVVPAGGQGQPYRGQGQGGRPDGESGRATPPPQISELPDEEAAAYMQLQREYKELLKKYYFEKESQVHQLQNTLAHQRLSQSRTSLDDTEYATRFTRLDGLIAQLSYSIRKSWKTIPEFLHRAINKDALVTGKQEMTAVGRAYFSHWIFHNVFESLFHPDLEPGLSRDLKEVMVNIRRNCPPFQSGEEEEALTAKLINWRLTTLEGLQDRLKSAEAQQHRHRLVEKLNDKLVADISGLLVDPAPPDLNGGVQMILDLAINIAVHVPLESRDVVIEYFPPGYPIVPDVMKVEVGIPGLTNAILPTETSPADSTDRASLKSNDTKDSVTDPSEITGSKDEGRGGGKRGMFSGIIGGGGGGGGKVTKAAPPGQQPGSGPAGKGSQGSVGAPTSQGQGARETPSPKEERVRLAAFLAVQIRGRSVLVKAPVYTTPV
ncbi:hypothetical protein EJ08DRAFT_213202 [Tothia fuscella]|uniref:Uncharacterized protein n=1 Tax=Tothia fuscella TaxID=1048955 RepID=A0A9P4NT71_9PEZI|nr:hypothetical protein EJ08DRAFT_213202 [Tothia fuscella]